MQSGWSILTMPLAMACTLGSSVPELVLIEEDAFPLPAGIAVRSVEVVCDGSVAVSAEGPRLILIDSTLQGRELTLSTQGSPIGMSVGTGNKCLRVLVDEDTALTEIAFPSGERATLWRDPRHVVAHFFSAVPWNGGWAIGAALWDQRLVIVAVDSAANWSEIADVSQQAFGASATDRGLGQALTLSTTGQTLLTSYVGYPHFTFEVMGHGALTHMLPDGRATGRRTLTTMVTTGFFQVGPSYIQVLADPSSNERVIRRFLAHSSRVTTRELMVPWGIASVLEGGGRILAIRGFSSPELVFYRVTQ